MRFCPPYHRIILSLLALCVLLVPACSSDNPVGTQTIQNQPATWRVFSQKTTFNAVLTFDDGFGVTVDNEGRTFRRSGDRWTEGAKLDDTGAVRVGGLWGPASNDVFAAATVGRILHFDGSAWADMTSGVSVDLHGVWGTSSDNVFAVGDGGTILHYDGSAWSAMTSNTTSALYGVHGTGPSQVFAVGSGGAFAEYDGALWSAHNQGAKDLRSVYAPNADEVIAVGPANRVVARIGGAWGPVDVGASGGWLSISGTSANDVYISGSNSAVVHFDGLGWNTIHEYNLAEIGLGDIQATSSGAIAVGGFARILDYDGSTWHTEHEAPLPSPHLTDIWEASNGDAFVVGLYNVFRVSGEGRSAYFFPTAIDLWGSGPDDVFAVGREGRIAHYDGASWSEQTSGTTSDLRLVYGTAPNDVLAVGKAAVHYDGSAWTPVTLPAGPYFNGIWGDGYEQYLLVGREGAAWKYTGVQWAELDSGTQNDLRDVWGSSWDDIYAVGVAGTLIHYDGAAWTPMDPGTTEDLNNIWGRGPSDIFVGGGHYRLLPDDSEDYYAIALHFDGDAWRNIFSAVDFPLSGVSGNADETTWVGGSTAYRYGP